MFMNFGFNPPTSTLLQFYVGNALTQSQILNLPDPFLQQQFMQIIQQITSQSQPMRVKMSRDIEIWDGFEGKMKTIENSIEFQNWKDDE